MSVSHSGLRRAAAAAAALLWLAALLFSAAVVAETIAVKSAVVRAQEDAFVLDAEFDFSVLTPAEAAYYMFGDLDEVEETLGGVRFRFRPALITALTHASNRLAPVTDACIQFTDTVIETAKIEHAALH